MRRSLARACAVAVASLLLASTALGETEAERERNKSTAREIAKQAQEAFDKGDFKSSEDLFGRADRLYHAPTLALGLARSYAKNGKLILAQETYNKIIREDDKPGAPAAFAQAVTDAKGEIGAVSARIGSVVIRVNGPSADATKVTLDGDPFPSAALGIKSPVDPGKHTVHASAQGYKDGEAQFTVADAAATEATVTLDKDTAAPAVAVVATPAGAQPAGTPQAANNPPPAVDKGSGGGGGKTLAWVAFGVGGVGLAVGAVTGLIALGKHSDLKSACTLPGGGCPADQQSNLDSFHTMGTLSTVGFIVGGVGVAAGAVLLLTSGSSSEKAASAPGIQPYVGLGSAGAVGRF